MKILQLAALALAFISSPLLAQYPAKINVATLEPGHQVPEIIGKTLDGKDFNLHKDLKGKVVLLDFWATWCGPCVAETPNIKKNYKKWHSKGFEVVTISLDRDISKAKNYGIDKGLTWIQLCDGLAHKSPLARSFSIQGIPQIILLNRDGSVINPNIRGEELTKTLEVVMSGKYIPGKLVATQPKLADHIILLFEKLETALQGDSSEKSLSALRPLQKLGSYADSEMMRLAYKYRPLSNNGTHAKTIYLMADRVLTRGSINEEQAKYAGTSRAHAAIHLGATFVAEVQLLNYRLFKLQNSVYSQELGNHLALATNDSDKVVSIYHTSVTSGDANFKQVLTALENIKSMPPTTKNKELNELKYWISSQRNLPNNRVTATILNDKIVATYNARNTNLAGSIKLNLMVLCDSGQNYAIPMTLNADKGIFEASAPLPAGVKKVRLYFRDTFKRSDSNLGEYWILSR